MEKERRGLVEVKVWDWQLRLLHWAMALLVITLLLLTVGYEWLEDMGVEEEGLEAIHKIHAYIGHILAVVFILRVAWGFVGNRYARWSDMIGLRWSDIWGHIRWILGGLKGVPPVSIGHNPLASLFYIPLFVVLTTQVISGLILAGEEFKMFPGNLIVENRVVTHTGEAMAHDGKEEEEEEGMEEFLEEIHEFGFYFIIFYLVAHLTGLVLHEIGERRGLFSSMINGRKYYHEDELEGD